MSSAELLDFDDIENWEPKLTAALSGHLPNSINAIVTARSPEYVEDARNILFDVADRNAIIEATLAWLQSSTLAAYHGTRLTESEVGSVRAKGLLLLKAEARRDRLARALSNHPRWNDIAGQLDDAIQAHGKGGKAGMRENQVHLTLSRTGLSVGFNHYLTHGSEFDQHVAHALLGQEGENLLQHDGVATIIKVGIDGIVALEAAHPFLVLTTCDAREKCRTLLTNTSKHGAIGWQIPTSNHGHSKLIRASFFASRFQPTGSSRSNNDRR